jgi:hypoxanthine-DNA glycosylase
LSARNLRNYDLAPIAIRAIHGFPPIARADARLLILGSMPSAASLAAAEYYAHPQNQFWRIAGDICGFDPGAPYSRRKAGLTGAGIALWDVIGAASAREPDSRSGTDPSQ